MRYIDRNSLTQPEILFSKRAEDARSKVDAFISQTSKKGGTRRVPSSEWLTRDAEFRQEMYEAFHGTCAYCERAAAPQPTTPSYGIVSHHRPKSLAQGEKGNTELLAYAWLIYEWENLLWVCTDCERRKGNRFYIESKRGEPGMIIEELREFEQELILDPCFHNPSEHLDFHIDGTVDSTTEKGHATTEVFDLNREELVRRRAIEIRYLLGSIGNFVTGIEAFAIGTRGDEDVFVLQRPPTRSDEHRSFAYVGAATQAILNFARIRGIEVNNAKSLITKLRGLKEGELVTFVEEALRANASQSGDQSPLTTPIDTTSSARRMISKRRDRILDFRGVPAAIKTATLTNIIRVEISNFKALRKITIDLPTNIADPELSPCMILLGENATGKSSILEAMALALIGAYEARELNEMLKDEDLSPSELIHRPDLTDWDNPATEVAIRLNFQDLSTLIELTAKAGDTEFTGANTCARVILAYGPRRYFTNRKTRRFRAPAYRVRSLFDPMNMIANPIHWLSGLNGKQFYAAARALRVILMLDNQDDFERDNNSTTRGQIFIRQNGQRTALKDLSVGYKSIIAMACDIIRELLYHFDNLEYAHAVVFVDEIETHLHPSWKMRIMQLLRQAFPKVQFIVTTHDPLCLRGMYDGEVFVLQRSGVDAQVEKVPDLPSIRGMRAEQILTSEFFGLGSTDPETDAQLARYNILAARIEVLSGDEKAEMEQLRHALDENMVIGTTLAEQAYAEALKEQNTLNEVQPTRVPSPRRKELKARFSSLFEGLEKP